MFWSRNYIPPPAGWSRRPLTYWDCCEFGLNDSPVIGWVVTGDINVTNCSTALEKAVQRRAPWLGGRLAKTESGSPPYEIHVPPTVNNVKSFSLSIKEVETPLDSIISYTPNGAPEPSIRILEGYDQTIINPRSAAQGVEEYIRNDFPLLHLHLVKAPDATLISLAWSHPAMDAAGCAQLVTAWEEELNETSTDTVYDDHDPEKIFDFTKDIPLSPGFPIPGWIRPTMLDYARFMPSYLYDLCMNPAVDGEIFIPSALVNHWKREAERELPEGEWVSRNDLVEAWVFKHGWSYNSPSAPNTLFCAMCFRGRHPCLPRTIITNTAMSYVIPTLTTSELRSMSLAQLAHRIRIATHPFVDPDHVAKVVAYEVRNRKMSEGKAPYLPLGVPEGKHFGTISWAKLGLTSVKLGKGLETVACLTYNAGRRCATVTDSESGDWRVELKVGRKSWEGFRAQIEKEKTVLLDN